jgi:hypothetical protein
VGVHRTLAACILQANFAKVGNSVRYDMGIDTSDAIVT